MKRTKSFYIWLAVGIIIALGLLIFGTIFDLEISKSLADVKVGQYYTTNFFAVFFEIFGESVIYVLVACALGIIFNYFIKHPLKNKVFNIIVIVGTCIAGLVDTFYCLYKITKYLSFYTNIGLDVFRSTLPCFALQILLGAIIEALVYFAFSKVKKENLPKLAIWALIVLFVCGISNVIVQGTKLIAHRARYRAMMNEGYTNFEFFTPWYQIKGSTFASTFKGAGDYFKSFPSGHSCSAASVFLLALLPNFIQKINTKKHRIILWVVASVYTLLVTSSRIIAGAHFFTDVFIGAGVPLLTTLLAKWLVVDKYFANK